MDIHQIAFLLIPMDSPKYSWVLCSVHILAVLALIQHHVLSLWSFRSISPNPLFLTSLPFFTRSPIVYLTLLRLTHLLLDRTLVPSLCSICTSLLPVVRSPFTFSCVKSVLYHHGFCSYVTYPYQYIWLNSFISFPPVGLDS